MNTAKLMLLGVMASVVTLNVQAGQVVDGEWPIVVVGPVAAKHHEVLDLRLSERWGKANDPVTGSDGSDPDKKLLH